MSDWPLEIKPTDVKTPECSGTSDGNMVELWKLCPHGMPSLLCAIIDAALFLEEICTYREAHGFPAVLSETLPASI